MSASAYRGNFCLLLPALHDEGRHVQAAAPNFNAVNSAQFHFKSSAF